MKILKLLYLSLLFLCIGCGDDDDSQNSNNITLEIVSISPQEIFTGQEITITAEQKGDIPVANDIEIRFDNEIFTANNIEIETEQATSTLVIKVYAPSSPKPEAILELKSGNLTDQSAVEIKESETEAISISIISPNNGPVGTQVALIGQGFQQVDKVSFAGDVEATILNINDTGTSMSVNVPVGALSGTISLHSGIFTITSDTSFTVTEN